MCTIRQDYFPVYTTLFDAVRLKKIEAPDSQILQPSYEWYVDQSRKIL